MDYQKETDARIVIDDLLRKAGWDPAEKSMVEIEVSVMRPGEAGRADGYDPDKIQGGRPETPERNDIPNLLARWRLYKKSGFKKPPGIKVGAILLEGTAESRSWWTTIDALTEDFSLAAGRTSPRSPSLPPRAIPRSSSARPSLWSARS